jgi:hypothetical protein
LTVDSFKYLPRLIARFYQGLELEPLGTIPWALPKKPLSECKFGLVTSAGLYQKDVDAPFDLEGERREPTWGDPTYRTIPVDIPQGQVGSSHLHYNPQDVLEDVNILLPLERFSELAAEGVIGGLAEKAYSFMGYQGFPPGASQWRETYAPQVAEQLKKEGVDCVFLTPA